MQAVEPQIAELLRTTIHPPSLLLRVAHVEFDKVENYHAESFTTNSDDERLDLRKKNGYLGKFLLSDGELMIQALLHRRLSGLEDVGSVEKGDLLDIRRFTVNKAPRLNGHGKVVFLGIEDCTFLLRPAAERAHTEGSVQQGTEINTTSKKRTRTEEDDSFTGKNDSHLLSTRPIAQSSPKRVRMSVTEPDDVILPSSIPSTPPLSLKETGESFAGQEKSNASNRAASPTAARTTSRIGKKQVGTQLSSDRLNRTFGARTIISDDEDDDEDFFESIQAIRTPAKVARSIIHNPYYSPQTSFRSNRRENTANSDAISPGLLKSMNHPSKEMAEPQLPPPLVSKRDGTFALSQTASFYQAQVAPHRRPTTAPQQDTRTAPSKDTTHPPNQTQQVTLLPTPPFYTLQALRNPPQTQSLPKNNFTVTVLAIISWTGTSILHRAGSPFPPKRHLKIVDPSLTASRPESRESQLPLQVQNLANTVAPRSSNNAGIFKPQTTFQDSVTVAVYVDAADFKPVAGTIALFRGLVMQRLANGDIILNAYGRLKEQRFADNTVKTGSTAEDPATDQGQLDDKFSHWFITDPDRVRALGYGGKMDYYREWWNRKQSAT